MRRLIEAAHLRVTIPRGVGLVDDDAMTDSRPVGIAQPQKVYRDADGRPWDRKRDWRPAAYSAATVVGLVIVFVTRWVRGDSWSDFLGVALYSVGWALVPFTGLYLLTGQVDKLRRQPDLTQSYFDAQADPGSQLPYVVVSLAESRRKD